MCNYQIHIYFITTRYENIKINVLILQNQATLNIIFISQYKFLCITITTKFYIMIYRISRHHYCHTH